MSASRSSSRGGNTKGPRRGSNAGLAADSSISIVRTTISALLVLAGIAWLVVYVGVADDKTLGWMTDLTRWNYLIGFGLIWLGLITAAHKSTPLGRGRGVVVGMLGCFLIGLLWIVMYYVTGSDVTIPVLTDLSQYNLMVGIGFMAVGFVYATHWE